jgi:diguanylate cyclase (GGDEF)-like protein/PAS domain S-box-containing protein
MNGKLRTESAIELLVIDDSPNDTEVYASTLRNSGLAIHHKRVDKEEDLLEALTNTSLDTILYSYDTAELEVRHVVALCRKAAVDTPLIILYPEDLKDREPLLEAMEKGVYDVVPKKDLEHLRLAVSREYNNLCERRELKQMKSKLLEMEERCNSLVEFSRDAIAYVHEGMYINANQAYLDMFGYVEMDDIEGLPILDMVAPEDLQVFKEYLRSLDKSDAASELEIRCRKSDGIIFDSKLEFSPASVDGEPCTQIIIRDQSLGKELEHKMNLLLKQDTQTGLANRQYFMEKLDEITSSKDSLQPPLSLVYILLDEFPKLRSSVGISSGDSILKEIAEVLSGEIQEDDTLARFGDHTFVILSNLAHAEEAEPFAEKIRGAVSGHKYKTTPSKTKITCSIGIGYLTANTSSSQELINQAFNACESVRNEGGNMVLSYDEAEMKPSFSEHVGDDTRITGLIQQALEQNRFRLLYQPIVSLQGDTRENYSVMVRLLNEDDEEVLPEDFISQAEQASLMPEIDRWVIKNALVELTKQRAQGHKVKFFINISGDGIVDESLMLWICDRLREANAKGAWITFQFRDSDLRAHTQAAKKLIEGLKKIRCQIAVDQFGLNPKGETLLKNLAIDYVKLDRSFTHNLASDQELQDKLHEAHNKAKSFEISTVAMGVEDANSLAVLWTVGVNYIQGNFLQKPSETISYDFNSV